MAEWQPIETAPMNVEVIVLSDFDGDRPIGRPIAFTAICCGETSTAFEGDEEIEKLSWRKSVAGYLHSVDDFYGDSPIFPTHWQPLPAPPTNPIPKGE